MEGVTGSIPVPPTTFIIKFRWLGAHLRRRIIFGQAPIPYRYRSGETQRNTEIALTCLCAPEKIASTNQNADERFPIILAFSRYPQVSRLKLGQTPS